jgi:hypothetical protein
MPYSINEVLILIDSEISNRKNQNDPISNIRIKALKNLQHYLVNNGYPLCTDDRLSLSLMPYVFQELNYDDFDWSKKQNSLGHLEEIVNIDVAVFFRGQKRSEITDGEYQQYWEHSIDAIGSLKKRGGKSSTSHQ